MNHFRVIVEVDVKSKSGIGAQDYIRNALASKNAVIRVVDCKASELEEPAPYVEPKVSKQITFLVNEHDQILVGPNKIPLHTWNPINLGEWVRRNAVALPSVEGGEPNGTRA